MEEKCVGAINAERTVADDGNNHKIELINDLGNAVRSLLDQHTSNPPSKMWGVYSGMAKVLELIEMVLKDGSTKLDYRGRVECRSFVLEASGDSGVGMFGSCSIVSWAQLHLANQRLSIKLRELYSDKDRLKTFYRADSISLDPVMRQTFLLIVEALEHMDVERLDALYTDEGAMSTLDKQNCETATLDKQTSGMATLEKQTKDKTSEEHGYSHIITDKHKINSRADENRKKIGHKTHRRSASCPIIQEGKIVKIAGGMDRNEMKQAHYRHTTGHAKDVDALKGRDQPDVGDGEDGPEVDQTSHLLRGLMRSETSTEDNQNDPIKKEQTSTSKVGVTSRCETPGRLQPAASSWRGHRRGASDSGLRLMRSPEPRMMMLHREEMNSSQEIKGTWSEVMPAKSGGGYQRPRANQSLVSFLSETGMAASGKGKRGQLDRENAHFVLSEAMIGTLEHLGFDSSMRSIDENEESDEEIRNLREKLESADHQRRRVRSSPKSSRHGAHTGDEQLSYKPGSSRSHKVRRTRKQGGRPQGLLSDGRTDTATTDQSGSTDCNSDGCLSGEELDKLLDSNDEDFSRFEPGSKDFLKDVAPGSAESIALSLLGQIGARRLPPADQIPWLVTEQEAPQQLLPLPDSLPVDPDEDDLKGATELRGTLVWAPPRPQLVLTVQENPPNRKTAMFQQRWQCAGCALRVEQKYSKSFRFCSYLGKYFCTGCHENQMAIIPARVIQHWDFKKHPVSNFSMEILNSVYTERLFNILDLNPVLMRKVEKVKTVVKVRRQLIKLNKYVSTCRYAHHLIDQVNEHVSPDPHLFSVEELFNTKFHKLGFTLRNLMSEGVKHVKSCQLCQARGFICEGCHSGEIIFSFQIGVYECPSCFSCYHKACFKPDQDQCSKCQRLQVRAEKSREEVGEQSEEGDDQSN